MELSSSYKFLACPNDLMDISLRVNRVKGREWMKGKRQREKEKERERERKKEVNVKMDYSVPCQYCFISLEANWWGEDSAVI